MGRHKNITQSTNEVIEDNVEGSNLVIEDNVEKSELSTLQKVEEPKKIKIIDNFEEEYYKYLKSTGLDVNFRGTWQKMYAYFINQIFGIKGKFVLDIGCAMGAITSSFAEYKANCIGVDISKFFIENSKFKNIKLLNTPAWNLKEIPDSSIDFIHSMKTFNYIPENKISEVFSEMKRVAKNDAIIFIVLDAMGYQKIKQEDSIIPSTIFPKFFFDEHARNCEMKDGSKLFYPKLMQTRTPGWDFMRKYNWPYLLYKVVK